MKAPGGGGGQLTSELLLNSEINKTRTLSDMDRNLLARANGDTFFFQQSIASLKKGPNLPLF